LGDPIWQRDGISFAHGAAQRYSAGPWKLDAARTSRT
jgi:hypothetical protein